MLYSRVLSLADLVAPLTGCVDRNDHIYNGLDFGFASHPSRGAWIEISNKPRDFNLASVAPLTGCVDRNVKAEVDKTFKDSVAPLTGCVDRNRRTRGHQDFAPGRTPHGVRG